MAVERLAGKLAEQDRDLIALTRVWVPPYERERNGQIEQVDGYWRVIHRLSDLAADEVASMLRHSVVKFKGKLPRGITREEYLGRGMDEHTRDEFQIRRHLSELESKAAHSTVIRSAPTQAEQIEMVPSLGRLDRFQPHGPVRSPWRNVLRVGALQGIRMFHGSRRS